MVVGNGPSVGWCAAAAKVLQVLAVARLVTEMFKKLKEKEKDRSEKSIAVS